MRLIFTLFAFILLSAQLPAQKITGIWRGYFSSSSNLYKDGGLPPEMYKYEIQIDQQTNNGLKGVTYSYKTTVFYGKASIQGIYNVTAKTILLKETALLDLKIGDKSEPCLMTCYLDYNKIGKLEVLQGTFISTNIKDKGDCGSGKVYLERVPDSDFEKEDFLLKKGEKKKTKDTLAKKSTIAPATKPVITKSNTPAQKPTVKTTAPATKPKLKISPTEKPKVVAEEPIIPKEDVIAPVQPKRIPIETEAREKRAAPVPKVLQERENNLVKTLVVDEDYIQIDLFDNGTIDNDTISVYHNNVQVIKSARLAFNPISIKIKCTPTENMHELVIVAENLGEIPPNTALMVITAGRKRYEVFLTSTEKRNAKVVIEYVPKK